MNRNERLKALFSLRNRAIAARKRPTEESLDLLDGGSSQGTEGISKSLGTSPSTGNFFKPLSQQATGSINRPNGFASFIMMGFITFFFETLFLGISYLIFK